MIHKYRFEAMTTPCEMQFVCDNHSVADACAQAVLKETKRLEQKYNYFNPNSYLSKINNRKEKHLDSESKQLLQRAKLYYNKTHGLFDITVATLKDNFFQKSLKEFHFCHDKLYQFVGCEHFEINKNNIKFDNEFTKIDLGGFVKEYAVDKAVLILKKYKIKSGYVNFGGDVFVLGKKSNNTKYTVGIKNPKDPSKNILSVELENQALTTSASYERNYHIEDKEFSHIISKNPSSQDILSATVVSNSCVESGVYSTVLMIKKIDIKKDFYLIDENLNIIYND